VLAAAADAFDLGDGLRGHRDAAPPATCELSADQFDQAMSAPAEAQLSLVNAIRRSLDKEQGALSTWLGGS
jgi:hypothetical protein